MHLTDSQIHFNRDRFPFQLIIIVLILVTYSNHVGQCSFFTWFNDTQHNGDMVEIHDEQVAEIIKDDLWPNPLTYFNNDADEEEFEMEDEFEMDDNDDDDDDEEKGSDGSEEDDDDGEQDDVDDD
ncbi:uncharacterized protein [Primulina huaijiensis]|uniref:uncharacterized protein n=1 Tax=Primulina huaijiensis TaxID=1492673 RepID=UPI003CC78E1B